MAFRAPRPAEGEEPVSCGGGSVRQVTLVQVPLREGPRRTGATSAGEGALDLPRVPAPQGPSSPSAGHPPSKEAVPVVEEAAVE